MTALHDAARLAPYDDSQGLAQALRKIADNDPDAPVSYWLKEAAIHIAGLWEAANSISGAKDHIGTHGHDCWRCWHRHYECAEIERLRAALQQIADHEYAGRSGWHHWKRLAREALAPNASLSGGRRPSA